MNSSPAHSSTFGYTLARVVMVVVTVMVRGRRGKGGRGEEKGN